MAVILCTLPGKYGDQLWACAVARAIAEANGGQVALALSGKYPTLAPLLRLQPYVSVVHVCEDWQPEEYATMTPPTPPTLPPGPWEAVVDLAYRAWPDRPLPQFGWHQVARDYRDVYLAPLDLTRPWITKVGGTCAFVTGTVGFSDEWFELKVGLYQLLCAPTHGWTYRTLRRVGSSPRWAREARRGRPAGEQTWEDAARRIRRSRVFLGCNSALHVLACAVGTPVVLMEPSEARQNAIFYPYGQDGPQVTLVRGHDGKPTFDARHVADALRKVLDR